MRLREYLDYLLGIMTIDLGIPLGVRGANEITSSVSLPAGTYLWKVDPRYRNAIGYRVSLRHAASGASGAFKFVAFDDRHQLDTPSRRLGESPLMTRNEGEISTWNLSSHMESLFVGVELPANNTRMALSVKPPGGFRGLEPFWYRGPVAATGSALQPGAVGDLPVVFAPPDFDTGERYPGLMLEPSSPAASALAAYYRTDFGTTDAGEISLATFCADILQEYISHYPDGVINFLTRAAFQQQHPGAIDREYLGYLMRRLTEQPLNMPDLETLPTRLTRRYRTNFIAPETIQGSRLEFLIGMLQRDLGGRGTHFLGYQAWEDEQQRRRFPENFYSSQVPLIRRRTLERADIDAFRARLPQQHSVQLVLEVLSRGLDLDGLLAGAYHALTRSEWGHASAALAQAEDTIAFLLRHNYALDSKMSTSQWAQNLAAEQQGVVFNPPVRTQLRERVVRLVQVNLGLFLANILALLEPNLSVPADPDQVLMYRRRPARSRTQLLELAKDVRWEMNERLPAVLSRLSDHNGNYSQLNAQDRNVLRDTIRDLWELVAHYAHFLLPLSFGECYRAAGEHARARMYYQLLLDDDDHAPAQMIRYPYLNLAIEVPFVALRAARNATDHADRLIRSLGQEPRIEAERLYERALRLVQSAVADANPVARQIVAECQIGLYKIHHHLNALGYPSDYAPIYRYAYLVGLAENLAQLAVDAARQYVATWQQAEQVARGEMEATQAVAMNDALVAVEQLRVREAALQVEIAQLQRAQIDQQIVDLQSKHDELDDWEFYAAAVGTGLSSSFGMMQAGIAVGGAVGGLVGVIAGSETGPGAAFTGAAGAVIGGAVGLLGGGVLGYAQGAAQWKAHDSMLHDLDRSRALLARFGTAIADRQIASAEHQQFIALKTLDVAQLRAGQAREIAALIADQMFNAEHLYALAGQMRAIYRTYLRYGHEMAFLAEQAMEFELSERVDVIGFDYDGPAGADVLGAERLRLALASLKTRRVDRFAQKRLPVSVTISLAEEFPLALFGLRTAGRATFETGFGLLDRLYPGAYQSRISRVELKVYALVPQAGLHGTLASTGLSFVKDAGGDIHALLHPPEQMLVSRYEIRDGAAYFSDTGEHLHPFEGMGVATAWTLDLPPASNALNYDTIADVHLVLHFTTLHSAELGDRVRGLLPPVEVAMRSFALRTALADAFYDVVQTGRAAFTLTRADFPRQHVEARIRKIMLLAVVAPDSAIDRLSFQIGYDDEAGRHAEQSVSVARSAASAPLDAAASPFASLAAYGSWTVSVELSDAAGRVLGDRTGIRDMLLFVEYEHERPGLRLREDFSRDVSTPTATSTVGAAWQLTSTGQAQHVALSAPEPNAVALEIRNDGSENRWITGPVATANIADVPVTDQTVVAWRQLDRAHALQLTLVVKGADGVERELVYSPNASNHWAREGWVSMAGSRPGTQPVYGVEETFLRLVGADHLAEFGVRPDSITRLRVSHFSNKRDTNDHGGMVRGLAIQHRRWVPLRGTWTWDAGTRTYGVSAGQPGGKLAATDIGVGDNYVVACRARARQANGEVDLWAAGGRYRLALRGGSGGQTGLYAHPAPYAGVPTQKVESPDVRVGAGRWHWLMIRKAGKTVTAFVDGQVLAEIVDDTSTAASEVALGSGQGDVVFDRLLVS